MTETPFMKEESSQKTRKPIMIVVRFKLMDDDVVVEALRGIGDVVLETRLIPIDKMMEALKTLGFNFGLHGCIKSKRIREEMEKGGVWIVAPGQYVEHGLWGMTPVQGDCGGMVIKLEGIEREIFGEVIMDEEKLERLIEAVRMIESLFHYLYAVAPLGVSVSEAFRRVIDYIKNVYTFIREEIEEPP